MITKNVAQKIAEQLSDLQYQCHNKKWMLRSRKGEFNGGRVQVEQVQGMVIEELDNTYKKDFTYSELTQCMNFLKIFLVH